MAITEKTDDLFSPVRFYMENNIYKTLGLFRKPGSFWPRFEIPIIAVFLAGMIYFSFSTVLGEEVSKAVFLMAIVASTWLDILKSGIIATFLSVFIMAYFSLGFDNLFSPANLPQIVDLLIFTAVALFISFLVSSLSWAKNRKQEIFNKLQESNYKIDRANKRIINIIKSISDGFIFFDKNNNFSYVNKQAEKFLGKSKESLIGKNLWKEFPHLKDSAFYKNYNKALKTGKSIRFEYFSPESSHWFLFSFFPAKEGESLYITDITPRKNLEIKQDEFIAVASHELKTPLTSIKLLVQMLKRRSKEDNNDINEDLESMEDQIDKLTNIINTLLAVSKLKEKKMSLDKSVFIINDLIEETASDVERLVVKHKIILEAEKGVQVLADSERIKQVLTNFINNAIKYSPDSNKVEVKLYTSSGYAIVSVRDFGIGIPEENKKKIFDRFFQVGQQHLRTSSEGLGLGLYISKEIIKAHKGKIWLESEEGKGSTFYFSIPLLN